MRYRVIRERERLVPRFSAMDMYVCQTGTPLGISSVLPNSGNPLGPGGHGSLALLCRHFQIKAREAAVHIDAT